MRLAASTIAATVWLCGSTLAAEHNIARGVGSASCSEYAQLYKADPKSADVVYATWAQGFMTGFNFSTMSESNGYRDLAAKSVDTLNAHVRQYCNAHPLARFLAAVTDFFGTLPVRHTD
jgi:hypothetical protein